jgi:hypothetical protein
MLTARLAAHLSPGCRLLDLPNEQDQPVGHLLAMFRTVLSNKLPISSSFPLHVLDFLSGQRREARRATRPGNCIVRHKRSKVNRYDEPPLLGHGGQRWRAATRHRFAAGLVTPSSGWWTLKLRVTDPQRAGAEGLVPDRRGWPGTVPAAGPGGRPSRPSIPNLDKGSGVRYHGHSQAESGGRAVPVRAFVAVALHRGLSSCASSIGGAEPQGRAVPARRSRRTRCEQERWGWSLAAGSARGPCLATD